ncbi:MAG: DrmE family protein [Candidatus Woesearchaeota archaeon]
MDIKKSNLVLYSKNDKHLRVNLELTKLSEAVLFSLFNSIKSKKNLIIVYPENIFRFASVVGYEFMERNNKDVLLFTSNNRSNEENFSKIHLENFCMMQEDNSSWFLWHKYVPCILENNKLYSEIVFKKGVKKKVKEEELQELTEKLDSVNNKFIICTELVDARKLSNIDTLSFQNSSYAFKEKTGLCIFENLSTKINSLQDVESFTNWLKPLLNGNMNFVFHISNFIDIKIIETLKEKTNSAVLYLSPELLTKAKSFFYDQSPTLKDSSTSNVSMNYNLDSDLIYLKEKPIRIVQINDFKFSTKRIQTLTNLVSKTSSVPYQIISRIKKVIFLLPKLVVNPVAWGRALTYKFDDVGFRHINIPELIRELNKYKFENRSEHFDLISELSHEITRLYNLFIETDRYMETKPYRKKTKPYILLQLLADLLKNKDKNIVVAVYDPSEKRVLQETLFSMNIKTDRVKVRTLNQLSQTVSVLENTTLILPSYIVMRYISEFFKAYEEIIVLSYIGEELMQIKSEISTINQANERFINQSIDYFNDLYRSFNWKNDSFIDELNKFKTNIEPSENSNAEKEDVLLKAKDSLMKHESFANGEDLFKDSQDEKIFDVNYADSKKDLLLNLVSIENPICRQIDVFNESMILSINEHKELEEKTASELSEGDLVILIQGDERKSFIDFLVKKSGLEDEIDTFHIKIWKDKLNEFIKKNSLSNDQLFDLYESLGGDVSTNPFDRWKDSVKNIAPRKKEDLRIIAEMIEYEPLQENLDQIFLDIKKLRVFHRQIGREMNKIIKDKLSGSFKESNYEDFDLYNKLKVFKLEKITPIDQKV